MLAERLFPATPRLPRLRRLAAAGACALALAAAACSSPPIRSTPQGEPASPRRARPDARSETPRARPQALSPRCESFCAAIRESALSAGHAELADDLCELARCETGDRCTGKIRSPNGRYVGAFQFSRGTWRSQCGPIFAKQGLSECRSPKARSDLRCSTACTSEILARRGAGDWPVCGKGIATR